MKINVTALDMFAMLYVLRGRLWDARIEDVQRYVEDVQKTNRPVHVRDYTGSVVAVFAVDAVCNRIWVRGV